LELELIGGGIGIDNLLLTEGTGSLRRRWTFEGAGNERLWELAIAMMGGAGNGKLLQMTKGNTGAGQLLWVSKYVYWRWEILHGGGRDLAVARWATTSIYVHILSYFAFKVSKF
jgi:hypothetical protein